MSFYLLTKISDTKHVFTWVKLNVLREVGKLQCQKFHVAI